MRYNRHKFPVLEDLRKLPEHGRMIAEKGRKREEKFYKAFKDHNFEHPEFYLGMRWATPEEDALGADFFMLTTEGEIPFDVKSSEIAVIISLETKRTDDLSIDIVVRERDSRAVIRNKAFNEAIKWRAKYLNITEDV